MKRASQPRCLRSNQPNISVGRKTTQGGRPTRTMSSCAFLLSYTSHSPAEFTTEELIWTRWQLPPAAAASSSRSVAVTLLSTNSCSTRPPIWACPMKSHPHLGSAACQPPLLARSASMTLMSGCSCRSTSRVGRVLVDGDDLVSAVPLQPRDQVLADQACRTGDGNFHAVAGRPNELTIASFHGVGDTHARIARSGAHNGAHGLQPPALPSLARQPPRFAGGIKFVAPEATLVRHSLGAPA